MMEFVSAVLLVVVFAAALVLLASAVLAVAVVANRAKFERSPTGSGPAGQ